MNEKIAKLSKRDAKYPRALKEIPDAPETLYVRGNIPTLPALAIVGSRRMTEESRTALTFLFRGCEYAPITVVSGLARGVDGLAHALALKHHVPTAAVLGSGIADDAIYPRQHVGLARDILKCGGAILSEYEPRSPGYPSHFPERNRIIAGMSRATLVVEAGDKSGALITAFLALEYNRDVAVIPHSIFHPNGKGIHRLLKRGAIPVTTPAELLALVECEVAEKQTLFIAKDELTLAALFAEKALCLDEICDALHLSIAQGMTRLSPLLSRNILIEQRDGRYALAVPLSHLHAGSEPPRV